MQNEDNWSIDLFYTFQRSSSTKPTSFSDATSFTMLMKGAEPKGKDSYICAGFSLNKTVPNGEYLSIFNLYFALINEFNVRG